MKNKTEEENNHYKTILYRPCNLKHPRSFPHQFGEESVEKNVQFVERQIK